MDGMVNIQDFMGYLQQNGLVIVSESLLEGAKKELDVRSYRDAIKYEKSLKVSDIVEGQLWGGIGAKAVRSAILAPSNGLKEGEDYIRVPDGNKIHPIIKVMRPAVDKIMRKRKIYYDGW